MTSYVCTTEAIYPRRVQLEIPWNVMRIGSDRGGSTQWLKKQKICKNNNKKKKVVTSNVNKKKKIE